MTALYERPVIRKLQGGLMNKFGTTPACTHKVRRDIDGVAIDDLIERHGSPLFVFSEREIRRKHRQVHRAFSTRYPNVQFGWSYKTNYLGAICQTMHQEGSIAEVVSEMEYEMARSLGVPGEEIIFNGPYKPLPILERAMAEGAMVNVDHEDEIDDLEKVADKLGRKLSIGMRLNLDSGIHPQWSRFGFNLESGQALEAVKRIANSDHLAIVGLHCHIGTYIIDASAYARQIAKMVEFAYQVKDGFGFSIEYLDIGGGFPSKNRLKGSYLSPDVALPTIDEYAEQVTGALTSCLRRGDMPKLILEAGRAMIDEAGYLITSVVASKRLPDGTRAYVVDAGVNVLFTSFWYKFNIELDREAHGISENSVIYGPLCMNIDVIDEGVMLPPLAKGAHMVVSPVGAYNTTQSLQFIQYRPNTVLVSEDGQVDVIREAEDLSDVTQREHIPARLQHPRGPRAASAMSA